MTLQQLATDLENSVHDGQLLARQSIATAIVFLVDAQRFTRQEVFDFVMGIIAETTVSYEPKPRAAGIHLVKSR